MKIGFKVNKIVLRAIYLAFIAFSAFWLYRIYGLQDYGVHFFGSNPQTALALHILLTVGIIAIATYGLWGTVERGLDKMKLGVIRLPVILIALGLVLFVIPIVIPMPLVEVISRSLNPLQIGGAGTAIAGLALLIFNILEESIKRKKTGMLARAET